MARNKTHFPSDVRNLNAHSSLMHIHAHVFSRRIARFKNLYICSKCRFKSHPLNGFEPGLQLARENNFRRGFAFLGRRREFVLSCSHWNTLVTLVNLRKNSDMYSYVHHSALILKRGTRDEFLLINNLISDSKICYVFRK